MRVDFSSKEDLSKFLDQRTSEGFTILGALRWVLFVQKLLLVIMWESKFLTSKNIYDIMENYRNNTKSKG